MITLILKTLFLYFFIAFAYRVMGKKEVGKLSIIDLIVSILIAELAAMSIEEESKSILYSVIPIMVLVLLQIALSFLSMKSFSLRKLIDGSPTVIVNNGKINFTEMKKLRYSLDDLLGQIREQGIKNIEEIDYAVLENNGKLSIFQKCNDYPMPIILDGQIDKDVLKDMHKCESWVYNILKKKNVKLDEVFYAFYTKDKTYIIKKADLI